MIINNYKMNKVDTLDRNSMITFDIYKAYKSGEIGVQSVISLVQDILNNPAFTDNSHVHTSICKIFLDLRKNDLITDEAIVNYLDSKNSFANGFLLKHITAINKYFKIIPMCKLFDIIIKTRTILNENARDNLLDSMDNSDDIENTFYYIDIFSRLYTDMSKLTTYKRESYLKKIEIAGCMIEGTSNGLDFAGRVLYGYDRSLSLSSFTNKLMYDISKIAYDNMFEEDKDVVKNIYYNIEDNLDDNIWED